MSESRIHHPGRPGERQPWLRPVDFTAPSAVPPDQQARLRRMAEELGPLVSPKAMNDLGIVMKLEPLWLEEMLWRDAHPMPADEAVTVKISSSAGGSLFLAIDPTMATLIVERLLGTEPDPARPLRAVTTIDRSLLGRVNEMLVAGLGRLWEEATGATLELERVAVHSDFTFGAEVTEPTLLLAVEVKLFDTFTMLHLLLPQSVTQPVGRSLSRPSARGESDDPEVTRAVHGKLGEANVDVQVQLGSVRLTAGEIADLHPGDRVSLPTAATEAAALIVDGVPVQYGHIGRSGGRRAVRIGLRGPGA
ncbi:MAG: FliM/FliN family flagellar motor switch protein [Solirubrobacteraceae bacterium]|nr:FliM/FliN family flagellar motor switch protein [Solirubrobacteraceae bacterium]